MQRAATLIDRDLRVRRHHRLTASKRCIRLTDVHLAIDHHRQASLSDGARIQFDVAVHHHRAGTRVDDHLGVEGADINLDILDIRQDAHLIATALRHQYLHGTGIQRRGGPQAVGAVNRIADTLRQREVLVVQLQVNDVTVAEGGRYRAFDSGTAADTSPRQLIHLYAAAAGRSPGPTDQHVALR